MCFPALEWPLASYFSFSLGFQEAQYTPANVDLGILETKPLLGSSTGCYRYMITFNPHQLAHIASYTRSLLHFSGRETNS